MEGQGIYFDHRPRVVWRRTTGQVHRGNGLLFRVVKNGSAFSDGSDTLSLPLALSLFGRSRLLRVRRYQVVNSNG